MTRKERAQVVELLRCAADLGISGVSCPLTEASHRLAGLSITDDADDVVRAVIDELSDPWWSGDTWEDYATHCLEAAARVEEGSWPVPAQEGAA